MKVTGIIAECNPLHEGHKYLLQEARKVTGADYIVIGHRNLIEFLSGIVCLILISDAGTVHADSLAKTLCKKFLGLCIDDLELK